MKNILLLTDFSRNATNALTYAMHFFKSKKCKFYILYVHKAGGYVSDDLLRSPKKSIHDSITEIPKSKLKTLIATLKAETTTQDYQFEMLIDYDVFTDAIHQAIDKFAIDFLVMGSNGASNVKEFIFGSNTINVIKKVHCKTLIVPSSYSFLPVKSMLISLNSNDSLNNHLLECLIDLTTDFKLKLHVIRVASSKDVERTALADKERLALLDVNYHIVKGVPMPYAVSSYLQTNDVDLAAFIAHNKSFLESLFVASTSAELRSRMELPLVVLHRK